MSLLEDSYETFRYIDKTTVPDGYGSVTPVWKEGAEFEATASDMNPTEVIAAQQSGVKASYKIITRKDINLTYGTIIQRESDGKYFIIKSDGNDNKTPASASLDMRVVKAEELKALPEG